MCRLGPQLLLSACCYLCLGSLVRPICRWSSLLVLTEFCVMQYNVIVTAGANQALSSCMLALVDPTDSVCIFKPYYFNCLVRLVAPSATWRVLCLRSALGVEHRTSSQVIRLQGDELSRAAACWPCWTGTTRDTESAYASALIIFFPLLGRP